MARLRQISRCRDNSSTSVRLGHARAPDGRGVLYHAYPDAALRRARERTNARSGATYDHTRSEQIQHGGHPSRRRRFTMAGAETRAPRCDGVDFRRPSNRPTGPPSGPRGTSPPRPIRAPSAHITTITVHRDDCPDMRAIQRLHGRSPPCPPLMPWTPPSPTPPGELSTGSRTPPPTPEWTRTA